LIPRSRTVLLLLLIVHLEPSDLTKKPA